MDTPKRTGFARRLLSLALAAVLLFSILPVTGLLAQAAEYYTASVTSIGSGTVRIDGIEQDTITVLEDSSVNLSFTAETGYWVRSVLVNGVEKASFEPGQQSSYSFDLVVKEDTNIQVTSSQVCDVEVQVSDTEAVAVKLNDVEATSCKVWSADNLSLDLQTKADQYAITNVVIGSENQTIADPSHFSKTVQVNSGLTIQVTSAVVVKHNLTVSKTGNGTVKINGTETEGEVFRIIEGNLAALEAVPATGWAIESVTFNGTAEFLTDAMKESFTHSYSIDAESTLGVIFAQKQFSVSASALEHGSVSFSYEETEPLPPFWVLYGEKIQFTLKPDSGYALTEVTINDKSPDEYGATSVPTSAGTVFTVPSVEENLTISATFEKQEDAEWSKVRFTEGYEGPYNVPADGEKPSRCVYVYPNTVSEVSFDFSVTGYGISNKQIFFNGANDATQKIKSSTAITSMRLAYKRYGGNRSVNVKLPADEVDFVLDKTAPTFRMEEEYDGQCFAEDAAISVMLMDEDWRTEEGLEQSEYDNRTYSGIKEMKYEIRARDAGGDYSLSPQDSGLITPVSPGKKTLSATLNLAFAQYDKKYVQIKLIAKDRAGNEATKIFEVAFSDETPVIAEFQYDEGDSYVTTNSAPYFPEGRKAQITVKEGAMSFNPDGVSFVGTVKTYNGQAVTEIIKNVTWTDSTDGEGNPIHIGSFELADGKYELTAVQYTNKAGRSDTLDLGEREEIDQKFTVDTVPPTGVITLSELGNYDSLLTTLTFGRWTKSTVTVTAALYDTTSLVYACHYYLHDGNEALTVAELDALSDSDWKPFNRASGFTVSTDRQFTVYLRIKDAALHTTYISTDSTILDQTLPALTLTPSGGVDGSGKLFGIHDDATVTIKTSEIAPGSGISSVRYYVERWQGSEHTVPQQETLFTFTPADPVLFADLVREKTFTVTVDKAKNNSSYVWFYAEVKDNAGNVNTESIPMDIDNTAPAVELTYEQEKNEAGIDGYYTAVTAVFKVTERTEHVGSVDDFLNFLSITATNVNGDPILLTRDVDWTVSAWESVEAEDPDKATHTLRIKFLTDGNYNLDLSYEDQAGNAAAPVTGSFSLDGTAPTGTITVGGKGTWTWLMDTLSFGLWSKNTVSVSATAEDMVSGVQGADYYKTDATTRLTKAELDALAAGAWKSFNLSDTLEIPANEQFSVYLRLRDKAGNTTYICTDGVIVDNQAGNIVLTPSAPGPNGIYGQANEVKVDVKVTDAAPYSGIQSVEYWITCDGVETARQKVYEYIYTRDPGDDAVGGELEIYEYGELVKSEKGVYPAQNELTESWNGVIEVDKTVNNSCDVKVFVQVVDNAGNMDTQNVNLEIDNTPPEIFVEYDNNTPHKISGDRGYYPAERTATVVIVERNHHFSAADAADGIAITATDAKGNAVLTDAQIKSMIGTWSYVPGGTPDEDRHIAKIHYAADANYTFEIGYADKAGNIGTVNTGTSVTPRIFTVDQTEPTGTVEAVGMSTWDKLVETLSFGLFSRVKVEFQGTWDDATSPIESVSWYKSAANNAMTRSALNAVTDWKPFSGLSVSPNERLTLYLRVVDYAGNVFYVSTDGIILDDRAPAVEQVAPRVTVSPAQPVNGIYNTDVPIRVTVTDPVVNGSYSGIKEIRYEVRNMGSVTQSGVLFNYAGTAHSQTELRQTWQSDSAIVVDKALNNSNDVEITVYAVDNAGNEGSGNAVIKIDITPPAVSVSYDNNNGDTAFADANTGAYFDAPRTATIVVTERNFDPASVNLTMTNSDGALPVLSAWRTEVGGGNGDSTRHIATLSYTADGNYSFDIACADLAGNRNTDVDYNGLAPQRFTIDRTAPVISVSYTPDGSAAKNGNYFNQPRTATITITERNFETSRINISLAATDHGNAVPVPAVSAWTSSGNVHTATVVYEADAYYTFDIDYRDKAGNAAEDYAGDAFFVDRTAPHVELRGVEDQSANNGRGKIGFTLTATDTNFDVFEPLLIGTFYEDGQFVTRTIDFGEVRDIPDGKEYVVDNLPDDGVYTVSCTATDKAGNDYEAYTLYHGDEPYAVPAAATRELLAFSVNRKGSVYDIDEATTDLVNKYYVQRVREDVVLVEINTDEVPEHSVTLNGRTLTEGTDYTVAVEGGDGKWMKYTYTVNRDLFEEEGAYTVVVSSTDRAGNATFSDVKGVGVKFVVDRTAPVVTVSGMETDGRYQTEVQTVTLVPTDDGGALRSLVVILVDEDGEPIRELVNLEGEELEKELEAHDGIITFTLNEGLYQNVRVICDDWADFGDEENIIYDETFTDISVSTSLIKIFWANKPLRWGTIGGVGGLGGAGLLFGLLKKRKKKEAVVEEAK